MTVVDWIAGFSRRLRLAVLALALALGVKTVAAALTPADPPSASVQITDSSIGATVEAGNHPR
jgi:hypothetical protein